MTPQKENVAFSKGLLNGPGQNNCFLNSAVQVLWHLDIFRRSFRELSGHSCMLDSCIFCALKELFAQLQFSHESALPPDALRKALAESFFDQQRFQLGFMDDAAECFENILLRIHYHLASTEAEDLCSAGHCIPHVKFAMTLVEQSVCGACGATSEPLPFTQMVHYVSASALISQAKQAPIPTHPDLFGQLLKKAGGMGDIRDCPSACGAKIQIRRTLTNHPEIVSVGIVWDSERPSLEHVMALLSTLRTSLRLSEVFHTPNPSQNNNNAHQLVGVVTYYGKHYSTFFFHTKLKIWIYFDDANVREVGPKWEQVVDKCRRGRYQPLLLLFAAPDGTPVDPSTAPKTTTVAPTAKPPLGRRSLTPSPEKPSLGTLAQRRAVTPNPDQTTDMNSQRPLQVLSEYQNLPGLQKAAMWSRKELVRRDSGNWSGDRNSASSSSSTSLENPYQYILGKMQNRTHIVPRSPTSLKGGESSSGGSQCDPGYDSYSLSSTDSLPLQQQLKHTLQLAQIPEGHHSPVSVLENIQFPQRKNQSECERLCDEADMLLKHSQATDDLEKALSFANAAVGKARQAMDAPYSNPQAAAAARMKHSTCIMQARSIHKKIEEPNGPRHGEGRHSREGSGCSGGRGSHSRQNSKDKGNHSRQNSKELLPDLKPPDVIESTPEKNIEIYATLPKTRKGLLSRATSKIKNAVEDEEYLMYDRPGRSLSRNKPPVGKKEEKRARSEERNNKNQKEKEFVSNQISKEAKKQMKAEEKKEGKKQHKVRRKLLMGGLIRRKNRSMPDLRDEEVTIKGGSKDDSNVGKMEKQPSLSGYLSEGHLEYTGNPNLERSKLMRKSLHGSKLIQLAKVPPPPPLRTTSQLSKGERQFQVAENMKENTLSLWKEPEPQSLPHYSSFSPNAESVTYANGGYLLNCQTKLVTTAQVHQVNSPDKEYHTTNKDDDDVFDLPPYPSPLNSVTHSRQASEEFPPPPNEIETLTPKSLLEQLQRKREQILQDNMQRDVTDSADHFRQNKNDHWLQELQAKQAAIKQRDSIECDILFNDNQQNNSQEMRMTPDAISEDIGKRLDDQISTVRDLKSKFETISLKTNDKYMRPPDMFSEKNKSSAFPPRDSPLSNQFERQESENSIKTLETEMKSNLRCDEMKRRPSKKKNVTFCEQVVLVATAEEDKVNSYIPNPILERVLRSVLHRDSHQETKEVAVHSVVPLKRNDSGSYGQCSVRNQVDNNNQKDNSIDEVGIQSADQPEKVTPLSQNDPANNPPGRTPFGTRTLPSPVPNRQPGRLQVAPQMSSMNQNPYQPVHSLVSPNLQMQTVNNHISEQNPNSPYLHMHSLQYNPEDQYHMSKLTSGLPRGNRQFCPETDGSRFNNNPVHSMIPARAELINSSSREYEQNSSPFQENPTFDQHNTSGETSLLYNGNSSMNNSPITPQQFHNIQHTTSVGNVQHNSGPMSLPPQQNFPHSSQYQSMNNSSYVQSSMMQSMNTQKPMPINEHLANSQTYQHLPSSVVQSQQQLAQQQHIMNSNGQVVNNNPASAMRHQQFQQANAGVMSSPYQPPPGMQRNLPSPSLHSQIMQNSGSSTGTHPNLSQSHTQLSSLQNFQRNNNPHFVNTNPYQMKSASPLSPNPPNDSAYPSGLPSQQHIPSSQNQQFSNQMPSYSSHMPLNNSSVPVNNQQHSNSALQASNNSNPMHGINSMTSLNHGYQGNQCLTQSNMPSPSLSVKSQMMQNHPQLSLLQSSNQPSPQMLQNGQNCYMTLPQKMRQPPTNGMSITQGQPKSRPQGMYQPESPIQEYTQQHLIKKDMPNGRPDVYQRVPNLLPDNYHNNSQFANGPLSPPYQNPPVPNGGIQNSASQQMLNPHSTSNQVLTAKYSPYQHPPLPRQVSTEQQKTPQNINPQNGRTTMCNLCRKKQIVPPSIYCSDCDFYMSRFKQRTS